MGCPFISQTYGIDGTSKTSELSGGRAGRQLSAHSPDQRKDLDVTMLTHPGGRYKPASYLSGPPKISGAITRGEHIAMLRRFCLCALVALLIGGGVAGIVALKAVIALSRINY